jgi:predicted  nucleic acid-binding Zn-ribbon protein
MGGTAHVIIEGFEIENWTCIKKLAVSGLPPTGVIVLHGPNRTGKSSLVQALRACLMDYPSTSTALKSFYPRGSGEKPAVSVVFTAGGATYRIKKWFGSSKSELASRTSTGDWRTETTTAAEAHGRVCGYAGGDDSDKGLRQLLWLTQAEFRLPDPKKFDAAVQAQLRGILGVLQTPLDDQFIERVKNRWNVWYSGQRKLGKQHKIKEGCKLAQNLSKLIEAQGRLNDSELEFNKVEGWLRQSSDLETLKMDLDRQLEEETSKSRKLQEERERSQTRIAARKLAEERYSRAEKELQEALGEEGQRADAAIRLVEAQNAVGPAKQKVESLEQIVQSMEAKQVERKTDLSAQRDMRRALQQRAHRVAAKLRVLDDTDKLSVARKDLQHAHDIAQEIADIKRYLAENPAPDKPKLDALRVNRQRALQLQADRDAASMTLSIVPVEGAGPAQLVLDGSPLRQLAITPPPSMYAVRRKAELHITGWGRVELSRGTGKSDLDQIEADLQRCHEEFAESVTSFGVAANDPDALDQLLRRNAKHGLKHAELKKQEGELKKLAPKGVEPLERKVLELETKQKGLAATDPDDTEPLPAERHELDLLKADLDNQMERLDGQNASLEKECEDAEANLGQRRAEVTSAKEGLAGAEATANSRREELSRWRTEEQIAQRVGNARRDLEAALSELKQSELTTEETTIDERLAACTEAVNALGKQIRENEEKYNRIKGLLESSEGLHALRASLSARVDEFTRLTERESLEKDAVDRLYELFEECREKQLGTLMGPIHDRVLNWMRVLDIGDYKEVRFGDTFLPDKLVRRDGTAEFTINEESTGAQEQIGMLVRLALGSLLTSSNEPAVAILDDPLTHCDVGRLNKMRVILRRAAEGDSRLNPPAGPLQIIILTCHPEWFRDERATVIDLEDASVMQRSAV